MKENVAYSRLRSEILKAGLTQSAAAAMCGTLASTFTHKLEGTTPWKIGEIVFWSDWLRQDANDLFLRPYRELQGRVMAERDKEAQE